MIDLRLGDCLEVMKGISDASIDAIIVDPPYIGMINESWDNKTFKEANDFFGASIEESSRILRSGGRLIMFGSHKTQEFIYPNITKNNLIHRELLFIDKGKQVLGGRNIGQYKMHPNVCELISINTKNARPKTSELLKDACSKYNISKDDFHDLIGVSKKGGGMWSIYTGKNKCGQVPTKEMWDKLRKPLNLIEYSKIEEVYNSTFGNTNILNFNFRIKNREHPTQKPIALMEYLIKTYTNENETVLDFTMGSGSTMVACDNLNRNGIGIEMDEKYFNIAQDRIKQNEYKLIK
jgi:DNA modification methylase